MKLELREPIIMLLRDGQRTVTEMAKELSAGNLSYNLSESGEVSAWRVICCNNTGMWEIDL